jgi:hypothetical protein
VDHRDARAGRADDGVRARLAERAHEPPDQRDRLAAVAGVRVHLAAAGLLAREDDLVPEPLEHGDGRLPGLREERVVQAGDEERDPHQREYVTASAVSSGSTLTFRVFALTVVLLELARRRV